MLLLGQICINDFLKGTVIEPMRDSVTLTHEPPLSRKSMKSDHIIKTKCSKCPKYAIKCLAFPLMLFLLSRVNFGDAVAGDEGEGVQGVHLMLLGTWHEAITSLEKVDSLEGETNSKSDFLNDIYVKYRSQLRKSFMRLEDRRLFLIPTKAEYQKNRE